MRIPLSAHLRKERACFAVGPAEQKFALPHASVAAHHISVETHQSAVREQHNLGELHCNREHERSLVSRQDDSDLYCCSVKPLTRLAATIVGAFRPSCYSIPQLTILKALVVAGILGIRSSLQKIGNHITMTVFTASPYSRLTYCSEVLSSGVSSTSAHLENKVYE